MLDFPDCASSVVGAIAACLNAFRDPRPLHEIAGRASFAFRLAYAPGAPRAALGAFPFAPTLAAAFDRLGYEMGFVHAEEGDLLRERALARAIRFVDAAIERRAPAIVWEPLDAPEFGAILERRGDRFAVAGLASSGIACALLPLDRLGAGATRTLFVAGAVERVEVDARRADAAAVRAAAVQLASSAAAIDSWIRDMTGGAIDPAGHARLLAVAAESRAYAASFLTDVAERAPEGADASLVRAADDLDASAQVFAGIQREVFPRLEDVPLAERRAIAAGMLATAKRREESARRHLDEAAAALR